MRAVLNRPVLFLQHGVFSDSFAWTGNLANDVCLCRTPALMCGWRTHEGTPSSQKHIGYGPDEARFWNFTKSLYFVGHSQGTVLMFAKLAGDPDYAKKIRQFHALAPVATVSHIGGLFRIFGYRLIDIAKFLLARLPNAPLMCSEFIQKN
ncbi:hypothetical protein OSTOST_07560 [Ostertagia ostertagi]